MTDGRTALVLGVTVGVGGAIAEALLHRGWRLRALVRNAKAVPERFRPHAGSMTLFEGDVLDRASVTRAAQGVDVIVHAVNRRDTGTGTRSSCR